MSDTKAMESVDVVIVGAGLAGLTAARELHKKAPHLKVVVLEAKDRVGGRTHTVTLKTAKGADQWDIGGQWVGTSQSYLLDLMNELNLETYPQYSDGLKLGQLGGTRVRSYDTALPTNNSITQYSPLEALDCVQLFYRLEKMATQVAVDNPFAHPRAVEWDGMSVAEYVRRNCWTRTMRDTADVACEAVYGCRSEKLSLLFFLLYANGAGAIGDLLETVGTGAQSMRIKGGSQQLSQLMCDDLAVSGVEVKLGTAVYKITRHNSSNKSDNSNIILCTAPTLPFDPEKSKYIRCKRVVLALPPEQIAAIEFEPPLPERKQKLYSGFPQGGLLKFIVTYPRPFWREKGLSGEIAATGFTNERGRINPILVTFDATTDDSSAAIVGFLNQDEWADKEALERRDAVLTDLARYFGDEALAYIDYVDKAWSKEPYNGGCPVGCLPPGGTENFLCIREPIDSIHFAGTETATQWPGYMSGAVQSGRRVAAELLHHLAPDRVTPAELQGSVYGASYLPPDVPDRSYIEKGWLRRNFGNLVLFGMGTILVVLVAKRWGCDVKTPSFLKMRH